jgi:5-methylcytosine-specific restriction endonuclease McrA
MKKMRHRPRVIDDAEEPGRVLYVYRPRMPRKEFLALNNDYSPPVGKPGKAARAERKRRRVARREARRLSKRPRSDAPWWQDRRAKVLAVGRCAYCGATEQLTVDHITPLGAGGTNALRNLQCLCNGCNQAKGAQTGFFRVL